MIHIAYNLWIAYGELCLIFVGKDKLMKNEIHWVYIYGVSQRLKDWLLTNKCKREEKT